MRTLRIGVIDLVTKGPTRALYARVMHANLASIMPQVLGVWCEAEGHEVTFVCYTGLEDLVDDLPDEVDLVFIGAFTEARIPRTRLSNLFRRGAPSPSWVVLTPAAIRRTPEVLRLRPGFHRPGRRSVKSCGIARRIGPSACSSAPNGSRTLPGVVSAGSSSSRRSRRLPSSRSCRCSGASAALTRATSASTPPFRTSRSISGVLATTSGSSGEDSSGRASPGTIPTSACASTTRWRRSTPRCRRDRIEFVAESSLSLLSEPHLKRLKRNGFKVLLRASNRGTTWATSRRPARDQGLDKVRQVSEHVNMILRYIPYVQTNFVLGLDVGRRRRTLRTDQALRGATPGAFPGYSLLSAFGRAAPLNLEYQRGPGAPLPVPFPQQQSGDEREAAELLLAGLLRPHHRPDQVHVPGAPSPTASGRTGRRF